MTSEPGASAQPGSSEAKDDRKAVRIDLTSDYGCYWCFAAKRRLDKAISLLDSSKVTVEVVWHPYMLCKSPGAGTGVSKREVWRTKVGTCFASIMARSEALRETDGLIIDWDGPVVSTLNAQCLTAWAANTGKQSQVADGLFERYQTKGQDISKLDVLLEVVEECGLDVEAAKKMLESGALVDEVKARAESAIAKGVTGVPHFVVNHKFQFSGAQPLDFYQCVFAKLGVYTLPANQPLRCTAEEAPVCKQKPIEPPKPAKTSTCFLGNLFSSFCSKDPAPPKDKA